ncbi:hypothetical protein [Sinorhizobium arboris]|uniref:hypothetical protein n=1 Tax=Sinorhizobium arboris TaxID=76745 RepID=UPI00067F6CE6|nr:hypothetical protein [Sinorhizobium arboris]
MHRRAEPRSIVGRAVLDFDDEPRIEGRPLSRISARISDDPAFTDPVVDLLMDVTMHPQRRPSFDDDLFQIGGIAGAQRIAVELG